MTGIIVELVPGKRSGVIRTQDGSRIVFFDSAVLGSFDTLTVGHRVNFDLDRASPQPSAVRVLREPCRRMPFRPAEAPLDLRYGGFDQAENVRTYKFHAVARGHSVQNFVVTVDVDLLLKHHVVVQEVPALCLRKLAADLERSPDSERHELGDDDLLAYASSRAALAQRKRSKAGFRGRRGPAPPGPWGHPPGSG